MRSLLRETFLADRRTTLGEYLESREGRHVMDARPPPSVARRYNG
jgi:hypothetical protein